MDSSEPVFNAMGAAGATPAPVTTGATGVTGDGEGAGVDAGALATVAGISVVVEQAAETNPTKANVA